MQLTSFIFLCFFALVFVIYSLLPQKIRWIWLLTTSYLFCISVDVKFGLILFLATLVSYLCGQLIGKSENRNVKKTYLFVGIIINAGLLFLFKYLNFFIGSLSSFLGLVGIHWNLGSVSLFLPLGISFYTFQTISYLIDIYNGVISPERNLGKYALYVAFFPKLLAGPIERGANLIPQIYHPHPFEYQRFVDGLVRIAWGFFKKLIIADRLAVIVNTVFKAPNDFYAPTLALAVLSFSFQVYIDFSAYCDIAIGTAKLLGIDLVENFNAPYFAETVTAFWRRWHISLTSWLRDYIFTPLNFASRRRRSKIYLYFNIMIVFLVSGIWHGANWTFVIWGLLHGLYQVIEAATQKFRDAAAKRFEINRQSFGHKFGKVILTFGLVTFAWIFFRANSVPDALHIIKSILTANGITFDGGWDFSILGLSTVNLWIAFFSSAIFFIFECVNMKHDLFKELNNQPIAFRWLVYLALIFSVIIFGFIGVYKPESFIYAQF
jgi:alginate O-acetyltransferase complex protein AlgI